MALTDRDLLSARKIPHMVFGTGTGLCAPPPPPSIYLPAEDRARARFSVNGNAIVTGGGGTLGSEAARALLEHGASGLMIFDISGALCQKAQVELQADFPEAKIGFVVVDITNEKEVESAISKTVETLGSVDILLCFAGVVHTQHALQMTAVEWRRMLEINTTGTFLCAQAAGKIMVQQGRGGRIVLVASISAHSVNWPQPQVGYNVSKAALLTMKNSLAAEWGRYGIRVNSISPGYMNTILNEGPGLAEARAEWASRNPMGRMGEPHELTGAVVLLCSQAGSYISGTDIIVDGGGMVL